MAFLDEEEQVGPAPAPESPRRPERERRRRRPQFLLRRLIGVGIGLAFVLLVVLAFRGCLEARSDRGITNYATDVGTIMRDSEQRGKEFFDLMESPAGRTSLQYQREIQLLRASSESLLDRAQKLDVPGQLSDAQESVVLSLRLRRDALARIGDNVTKALAEADQAEAVATITRQMASLYSSDVAYSQQGSPEIARVVEEEEVSVPKLTPGNFMPDPDPSSPQNTEWLTQTRVLEALALVSGVQDTGAETHGLGLATVAIGGVPLDPDAPNSLPDSSREVEVQVENQGDVQESDVQVVVALEGEDPVVDRIPRMEAGETAIVTVALQTLPQPGTEVTLEVLVQPVRGESVTDNNQATYRVTFG